MMRISSNVISRRCTNGSAFAIGNAMAVLLGALLLASCASLPTDYPRPASAALQDYKSTTLGSYLATKEAEHPGESGYALLRYGRPAFTTRVAFTELAQKTLDLQYYIWEADDTGRILAQKVLEAADRGVRVRVLLDDINLDHRDSVIAALDVHPNIEIRLFNPFANRSSHMGEFITGFSRVNHRMHNKLLVVDNSLAIVGGRNVGNHYFQVHTEANFRDMDVVICGPLVRDASAVFDHFFNGDWAVPISALVERPYTEADLQAARVNQREKIAAGSYPYPVNLDSAQIKQRLDEEIDDLFWAPGRIVWDDPEEIVATGKTSTMHEALYKRVDNLQSSLLIESPYFIPRDTGIQELKALHDRGVRVRLLTNSLASNDVEAAFAGYAARRRQIIESGVELYELRVDAGVVKKRLAFFGAKAALHAKVIVFDDRDVFIGSFNLDPRSADINTEAGVAAWDNPEFAAQVIEWMDEGVQPENSYRVTLDENGEMIWVTQDEGKEVVYHHDPQSTWWQRFKAGFIGILPVEDQL